MADYYNFQQVVQMCGIAESTLEQLQSKGLLEPTVKRGRPFLSSRQVYRLRIAVHQASEEKIDLQEALARVEERWLAQTVALRS
jgi:DNA-binding transcriptional MerR regulator